MKPQRFFPSGLPHCVRLLALLLSAALPVAAHAQTAPAPPKYAMLEYIKYEPGKAAEYRKVEQEVWQPIHRERIKAGVIRSWSLWSRTLPGGSAYDYDALIITTFDSFAAIGNPYPPGIAVKAHPTLTPQQIGEATGARTTATRRMVRTELVTILDATQEAVASQTPPKYLLVNYHQAEYGKANQYVKLEREAWKPVHQERVNQGILRLWVLLATRFPTGTERPYSHLTMEAFDKFEHLENRYPPVVLEKFGPVDKRDQIGAQTTALRKQVRTEVLTLVDVVR